MFTWLLKQSPKCQDMTVGFVFQLIFEDGFLHKSVPLSLLSACLLSFFAFVLSCHSDNEVSRHGLWLLSIGVENLDITVLFSDCKFFML